MTPPALAATTVREIFHSVSPRLIEELQALEFTTSYPTGSVLFVEGQSPRGIFLVLRGRVTLSVTSSDGRTLIARVAEAGEALGTSASVSNREYEATAETLEASEISFVKRTDVLRLMQSHKELVLWLAERLSHEYNLTCREIRNLMLADSARGKLARLLTDNLDKSASPGQPCRMRLGFTHEQIAQMMGLSRETVTRTFTAFKKQHLIEQCGATLIVRDRKALESMVLA